MSNCSRLSIRLSGLVLFCAWFVAVQVTGNLLAQELVPIAGKPDEGRNVRSNVETLPPPLMSQDVDPAQIETSGRAEIIRQRYPDGKVQIKRQVMQDADGNYLNHGPWELFNRSGQVLANGQFADGSMSGTWQRWHPADSLGLFADTPFDHYQGPFLSIATFTEGNLDGTWTVYDPQRRKILEIPYEQGKRHGVATWFWPNGRQMRRVGFTDGRLDGELIEWDQQNETLRKESYRDGKKLITRTTWHRDDQKQTEDNFLGFQLETIGEDDWWNAQPSSYDYLGDEVQHGLSRSWYSNGQLRMRGNFENGSQAGLFEWWHDNGQRQISGHFREGLKVGKWTWWHSNGRKAIEGSYTDDVASGQWTWWSPTGEVERQEDFSELSIPSDTEEINFQ